MPQIEVKIQIVSDLHLEFREEEAYESLITPSAPILALIGDICHLNTPEQSRRYCDFLTWCSERFGRVLLVAGNHEYYDACKKKCEIDNMLRFMCLDAGGSRGNVTFLDGQTHVYIEGFRIIGSTLWSHIPPLAESQVAEYMSKHYSILDEDGNLLTTAVYNRWHVAEKATIAEAIADDETNNGRGVIVLTHYAPYRWGCSAPEYETGDHLVNHIFASDLSDLWRNTSKTRVVLWAFGHTHYCCDFRVAGTRIVSNQLGRPHEKIGYRSDFVVSIP
jgi:predicted phosphodiesterase